jgi:hypothetical protein
VPRLPRCGHLASCEVALTAAWPLVVVRASIVQSPEDAACHAMVRELLRAESSFAKIMDGSREVAVAAERDGDRLAASRRHNVRESDIGY